MLVRTFRLTDKLTNALLRLMIWLSSVLLTQIYRLRLAFVSSFEALWLSVGQIAQGRGGYISVEERRAIMARRSAEMAATSRPIVREDPLKTQNRALSMFTVALMAALLVMVLWFTSNGPIGPAQTPRSAGGPIAGLQTKGAPTPIPTSVPTSTPIPDPLTAGGSVVYTMRENGRENLWVLGIGQSAPIRLTNSADDDREAVWSPTGDRVAFVSHRDGNWELYVMDVATGNTSRLTYDLGYEGSPTWSPDGVFIAYEAYENNNLDVYLIKSDGSEDPIQLTRNAAPDYSPSWAPGDGRRIAYVSLRDGNAEIYVIDLEKPIEDKAIRLTNTADIDENYPAWSPDGQIVAYSARVNGLDLVMTKPVTQPEAEPSIIGQGHQPTWSPNGASILAAVDNGNTTTFVGAQVGTIGVSALVVAAQGRATRPNWTRALLPTSLVQKSPLAGPSPAYEEVIHSESPNPPFNKLAVLAGFTIDNPQLSDKVDDSFIALRAAVYKATNIDLLGGIKEALWLRDRLPEPGQSRQSWHYAGRAFDFDRNLVFGQGDQPAPIEVVREDIGVNTYWRVYIRVPEQYQGGQLGEPLKQIPWDFASRSSGDPQAFEQGGRKKVNVPTGYYVDFTRIAEDYGWDRIPSERTWRSVYPGILYWEFNKRDGLSWTDAMLQIYSKEELSDFLNGATPVPTVAQPSQTPDRGPTRTPTPIPPDVGTSG